MCYPRKKSFTATRRLASLNKIYLCVAKGTLSHRCQVAIDIFFFTSTFLPGNRSIRQICISGSMTEIKERFELKFVKYHIMSDAEFIFGQYLEHLVNSTCKACFDIKVHTFYHCFIS